MMAGCATKPSTTPVAVTPEPTSQQRVIHEITVSEEQTAVVVTLRADQPMTYTSVKQLLPPGVVLYLPKTSLKGVQETCTPESTLIESITAYELKNGGGSSRIQINLKADVPYKATQENGRLLVYFRKPKAEPAVGEETVPKEEKEPTVAVREEVLEGEKSVEPVAGEAEAGKVEEPAWVNRIDFVTLEGGKSRVIVGTTTRVSYETAKPSDKRLLLKFFDAKISKFQKRPLITTRFNSAVDRIVPIQTPGMGDMAIVAIQLREAVPYRVEQKEDIIVVDFEPSSVPPRPMLDVKRPKWQQVMKEAEAEIVEEAGVPAEKVVLTEGGETYTGKKISLDFQDADIRHIFRILHEISGKNFVIGDDVKGKVTLKLDNVPWDQVLDLITRMNKLGTVEDGNVVRIAPLATLEAEKKALEAKVEAEKTAIKVQEELEPLVTEYISISYSEAETLQKHLQEIKTERGKVSLDERTNMIIMTDIKAKIEQAKKVINKLDVPTPQVMIEARIVKADTTFTRDIGVQWGGDISRGGSGKDEPLSRLFGGQTYTEGSQNYAVNLPPASITSGLGFTFGTLGSTVLNLDARLLAMETQGKGRTISAPKIVTLDNKEAYITQGKTVPYQTTEEGTVSIKFVEAVLKLTVTPHITPDNRIRMEILVQKDAPDWDKLVGGTPAIDKKEAKTELLVNNGETIVIGGILESTEAFTNARVPFFSKIPILGWFFRSKYTKKTKDELLIFITPKIIRLEQVPQVST